MSSCRATNAKACAQCPWRLTNQGKPHPDGFYLLSNLRRLLTGLRNGESNSCHLTDPSHPDHVKAGARVDSKALECAGAIVLVRRELAELANPSREITAESAKHYEEQRRGGFTRRGIVKWTVERIAFAGVPFLGGRPIPEVEDDAAIGLPAKLAPSWKGGAR